MTNERLAKWFPDERRVIPPNSADDDTHRAFIAELIQRLIDRPVDAVFTSESYGEGFAASSRIAYVSPDPFSMCSLIRLASIVPISTLLFVLTSMRRVSGCIPYRVCLFCRSHHVPRRRIEQQSTLTEALARAYGADSASVRRGAG